MTPSIPCIAVVGRAEVHPPDTVAVVSDRRLSVAALAALLLVDRGISVVRTGRGAETVEETLLAFTPAVVVVDGVSPEDLPALRAARTSGSRILLLLDPVDDVGAYRRAVGAGAHGYLSRSASREALQFAIEAVRTSGYYIDPLLAARVLSASEEARRTPLMSQPQLSQRERDIVTQIALGKSSKEIARTYAVTTKTICNHISNIYTKLSFRHRGQLVLYAAEHGLTGF